MRRISADYRRIAIDGLPDDLDAFLLEEYGIDMTARYAGYEIANPWGKASGQLSMTARQVEEDVQAGLGFIVLKTVIARDEAGSQSMQAWAVRESRMQAERITGQSGEQGWTISWKGRGWWRSFEDYLQLVRDSQQLAAKRGTLIVPSCKYHLPAFEEEIWKTEEYDYTTRKLYDAWMENSADTARPAMPLEKDFSPTLAGSDRAAVQSQILHWLQTVPRLIRSAIAPMQTSGEKACSAVRIGLKIFNALYDDDFQLSMLRAIHAEDEQSASSQPDFFIYGNRLFNPQRVFDGHRGIACGGPDLSDRNLRVLARFQQEAAAGRLGSPPLPISATGNITTGKMALEYALRGAENFQLHTFFQLPGDQYTMRPGGKTEKALHELYFNPQHGFLVWIRHLADRFGLATSPLCFQDVVGRGLDLLS
ncbi:MAG: hypothetical protein IID45_01420 [Planctomycetes bacterium]|nr:hypothetical protein [Planctomycetota bacterium]